MSIATRFVFPGLLPFCIEDKTSVQIAAISDGKFTGTLAAVMALFWNLETADFIYNGTTIGSSSFGSMDDAIAVPPINTSPRERMCYPGFILTANNSIGASQLMGSASTSTFTGPGGDPDRMAFCIQTVYRNSDTGDYVAICRLELGDPANAQFSTAPFAGSNANAGTVTIFGQSQTSFKDSSFVATKNFSIENPAYYSY